MQTLLYNSSKQENNKDRVCISFLLTCFKDNSKTFIELQTLVLLTMFQDLIDTKWLKNSDEA